jgi:methylglutaconyl-CoA hydratase
MNKPDKFQTILVNIEGQTAWVTLNRPDIHNAFNSLMISELYKAFSWIENNEIIRVVVLTGAGRSFCAGADLNWMREVIKYSFEQNLQESRQIADVLHKIYALPKPTIAMVNGTAIGGGTGLLSACDIVIAADKAKFGLSEVKLGLVPAAISPYVVRRIGESKARQYFLTGERISADRASEIGLINEVVSLEDLKARVDDLIDNLLTSGPEAIANCKELIFRVPRMDMEEAKEFTARMIANLRISREGQEGMAAFLEKRSPSWIKPK